MGNCLGFQKKKGLLLCSGNLSKSVNDLDFNRCVVCADYHLCQQCFPTDTHMQHNFQFRQVGLLNDFICLLLATEEKIGYTTVY